MDKFSPKPPDKIVFPKDGEIIVDPSGHEFRMGQKIGEGYFGHVFECSDEFGNDLVVKVLVPNGRSYEEVRGSWDLELKNLIQLRHPNITYIHAAFECDSTFHLIIERCFLTLEEFIGLDDSDGDLWVTHVARDILSALHFLHSYGYVHKDLHAGNVMMSQVKSRLNPDATPEWIFKIGDLGISKLETDINLFGSIMARWMLPPEYLDPRQFGVLGKQVDIYHTGLLLLGLVMGGVPSFSNADIVAGKPRETVQNLNSPFAKPIAKALRRHVNDRTQSALEFWRDLRDAAP